MGRGSLGLPAPNGKASVVLTPGWVVRQSAVLNTKVWDPENDEITFEDYGLPPTYAADITASLSSVSLVALYTPGGLTDEDLCYAVREGDVLLDEFSLILRDACGRGLARG